MKRVPIRYLTVLLCTCVGLVTFLCRSNINIAIVSMIPVEKVDENSTESVELCPNLGTGASGSGTDNETSLIPLGETFEWSPELQGSVLGCFFWTYCIFQAPSGYINGRYGGRIPVSMSLFGSSLISALNPVFAHVSVYLLIVSRMVMGIFQAAVFPGMFVIVVSFVTMQERPMAMAVMEVGSSVGTIVLYFSSGFLVQSFTWTSLFYMPSIVSFLLGIVFLLFIRNSPEEHPLITEEEVNHIKGKETTRQDLEMSQSDGKASPDSVSLASYEEDPSLVVQYAIPWRKMLTNKSVLALFLFKFARTLVFHFINSKIPFYLKHVLKEDIVSVGVIYAIFTGILFVTVLVTAKISESMIVKGMLSRTNCRRFFSLFSGTATAVAFMLIPTLRCNIIGVKVFFYFCAIGVGCGMASDVVIPPEMTTNFSTILYALCNMCHVIPGFVSPMFAGYVLGHLDSEWAAWDVIFYTIGGFLIFANIIFLIFIRAKKQDFDDVKEPPPRDSRAMSVISVLSNHQSHYV